MKRFADIDIVRQTLKDAMPLNEFISIADKRLHNQTGKQCDTLECVNDHLYKKRCDLDEHPIDKDGTRDSTPSFTVNPQKELFYCFGCGGSGDRFEYLSCQFHIDHIESIHMAADIENVDLTSYYADVSPAEQIKDNLFKENEQARDIAHKCLLEHQDALNYLLGRGMSMESIEQFKLGYAPPMNSDRVTIFDTVPNAKGLELDRKSQFNDAILFPITDVNGRMRYFQSRPFHPMTGMKYIGGNDTHPLFDGTDRIFGFNISKRQMCKNGGKLIGVEGAPDAISCIQHGIAACGFLGTVVNQMTFDLLDKYRVVELILLLDGDEAGRDRSIKICGNYINLKTNVRLKVAAMPDGDPDEYINANGVEALQKVIDGAIYAVQYLIDSQYSTNMTTPTAKIDFIHNVSPYMNAIHDKVMRQVMLDHIAGKIGFDPAQLDDYFTQTAAQAAGTKLYAPEEEEVLLGEAIRNPEFLAELVSKFSGSDWYLVKHKCLFNILKDAKYTDVESLFTIAKNMNVDNLISHDWLQSLYTNTGNVDFCLADVEDKLMRRQANEILDRTRAQVNDMQQDTSLVLDRSTTEIYNTMHSKTDEHVFDTKNQISENMALINERMKNPLKMIGWSCGDNFKKLSLTLLGLQNKKLIVVAANQTVGKTTICEDWALDQAINQHAKILWFTLEMDKAEMTFRNQSIMSGVPCTNIMTGNLTAEQYQKVCSASAAIENSDIYICDEGNDISEAVAVARQYKIKKHIDIIYVDYLQLQYVTYKKINERHRELGTISKTWKQLSKELGVPVVLVSQLSKEALKADVAEAEHNGGSYEVAQDADVYITLKDKDEAEIQQRGIDHGNKTLNISKNRMGEREVLIDLYLDGPCYHMSECN